MIKTKDLLIVRLQWPAASDGLSEKEIRHHKRILAAARRCLHEKAPITLAETGFQLLRYVDEAELFACLNNVLREIDMEASDILVMLSAPACDDYGEYYYEESLKESLEQMALTVEDLAAKIADKPPRVDAFNGVFKQLETLSGYVQSDDLISINKYLVKLEHWDYEDEKAKGLAYLGKLVEKIRKVEL